jgi:hypothetical protein
VELRFRRWKEKLLDLTLRNRLLNFKPDQKAALQLTVPDLELLENNVFANKSFELLPRPTAGLFDERDPTLARRRTQETTDKALLDDLRRCVVHSRHCADELWTRARHLDREARTALEEGGATVLYLAIGFLRWFEDATAQEPRLAPLLLYPIELAFDARGRRAKMRRLSDDPILNVTLVEKLRRDHAADVRDLETLPMADSADDDGVAVRELLRRFRVAVQHIPRWEVLEEAHVGLFHFTKFLMWKDLDDNAEAFLKNPVVLRIASREPVALEQNPSVQPEQVGRMHPAELPTVLDADSTQLAAVASALDGQSFVLQGPPGTGKSQTIANLIAAALARHRTVLFVSEKMAALEVVHRRLRDVGLGDFCLELHSHKANKKEVVASLKTALEHAGRTREDGWQSRGDSLLQARQQLDAYVDALHRPGALGLGVFDARNRILELADVQEEKIAPERAAALDVDSFRRLRQASDEFAAAAASVEPVHEHPYRDSRRTQWTVGVEEQLSHALAQAREHARTWEAVRSRLSSELGLGVLSSARVEDVASATRPLALSAVPESASTHQWPENSARARRCVADRRAADSARAELGKRWTEPFIETAPDALLARFERWAAAFFLFAWIMLWSARRQLRRMSRGPLPSNREILTDLQALAALRTDRARLDAEIAWTTALFKTAANDAARWSGALEALDRAHPALQRLESAGADCSRALAALRVPLTNDRRSALLAWSETADTAAAALKQSEARLRELLDLAPATFPSWEDERHTRAVLDAVEGWARDLRRFRGWCLYRGAADAIGKAGAPELAAAHLEGQQRASALTRALEKGVLLHWHAAAVDADAILRDFDSRQHSRRVDVFRDLDRAHVAASRQHVVSKLEERLPSREATNIASSEPSILMREAQKKARHLPIRRLLRDIPTILPRLKPCFLMSPLSVAQYLPADGKPFDLVVFDEASQICTHEAIGTIARGRQVIIVGDSRQMPPTSFFMRADADDELPDDDDVVELESVLDEAVAKLVPQQWLGWHYRSRHESLIEFSNRHIYDGRLDVFPAARFQSDDLGVEWRRVQGVYQSGKGPDGRTNRIEAEALVAHLVARLRSFEPGERTFGVVTFNVPQQQLVLDLLDEERVDPSVERHFAGTEPVFVKNLENVQGDERDEILFSICYAPNAEHRFRMHYGPLSAAGGERRLNVAVTRARQKLIVFSSIDPEQIDRSRTNARGAWLLREFLQHARERGRGAERAVTADVSNPAQVEVVARTLRSEGWRLDAGVGCSGYKLDLAVRHPVDEGRYGVAVECDGHAYRSALTASDRDRLRADVLRSLGWNLERVWSTSWWFDPDAPRALVDSVRKTLTAPEPVRPARPATTPTAVDGVRQGMTATPATNVRPLPPTQPATPPPLPTKASLTVQRYQGFAIARPGEADDFYSSASDELIRQQIVDTILHEGPIHEQLLARRVLSTWGIERLTANPTRRLDEMLAKARRTRPIRRQGEFWWPSSLDPATYRSYRGASSDDATIRDLPMIAPEEIANAIAAVLHDAGSMDEAALGREVAGLFGIQRVGAKVRDSIEKGVKVLEAAGRCDIRGARVHLVEQ